MSSNDDAVRAAERRAASFSRTKKITAHARGARSAFVFVVAYAALTGLGYANGEWYVAGWLRIFLVETISLLPRGFVAESIRLETQHSQRLIVVNTHTSLALYPRGIVPPDKPYEISTLQAYAISHAALVFSILAAWPTGGSPYRRILLLLLGIPCVLVSTSLDVPFVLAGLARRLIVAAVDPEAAGRDPLLLYYEFLQRGGRYGVIVALALLAAAAGSARAARTVDSSVSNTEETLT